MTNEEIIKLAKDAAVSAFDAHGAEDMPQPARALEFIIDVRTEDMSDADAEAFIKSCKCLDGSSTTDWTLFVGTYKMHFAGLSAPGGVK